MEKHFDFSLKEGSSMVVSGPTMCGKPTFLHALLNDKHMFRRPPERVCWFYGQATDDLKCKTGYIIQKGLPDSFEFIPQTAL